MDKFCPMHAIYFGGPACPECTREVNIGISDAHARWGLEATLSGKHTFGSGAHRSTVMPFYSAIPYMSLRRLALRATGAPSGETLTDTDTGHTYEGGSRKYGYGNWSKGLPLEDSLNHVLDHLLRWKTAILRGEVPSDDDLAAAAWGIMLPLMTFEAHYVEQAARRNHLVAEGSIDAAGIDDMMRAEFKGRGYLLQPLAPEKSKQVSAPNTLSVTKVFSPACPRCGGPSLVMEEHNAWLCAAQACGFKFYAQPVDPMVDPKVK